MRMADPFLTDPLLLLATDALWPVWLMTVRCYGLLTVAPIFSGAVVPHRLRVGLAIVLGVAAGTTASPLAQRPPLLWPEPLWLSLGEFALGAALGLGVTVVLAGLNVTASLLEQQWGITGTGDSLGAEAPPRPPLAHVFGGLGLVLFVTSAPLGGDLRLVRSWLDSLRMLPPGGVPDIASPVQVLQDFVAASLLLGLQAAAPVVVVLGIAQGTWAMLARNRGGAVWQVTLSPIRFLLGVVVLAATLTGVSERIAGALQSVSASSLGVKTPAEGLPP
jgi:flagellar biosynthesis protein FliR